MGRYVHNRCHEFLYNRFFMMQRSNTGPNPPTDIRIIPRPAQLLTDIQIIQSSAHPLTDMRIIKRPTQPLDWYPDYPKACSPPWLISRLSRGLLSLLTDILGLSQGLLSIWLISRLSKGLHSPLTDIQIIQTSAQPPEYIWKSLCFHVR